MTKLPLEVWVYFHDAEEGLPAEVVVDEKPPVDFTKYVLANEAARELDEARNLVAAQDAMLKHAASEHDAQAKQVEDLRGALDEARGIAYALVHAYGHDSRPPDFAVETARRYGLDAKARLDGAGEGG